MERLLFTPGSLDYAPKARVGDVQIISLTWSQFLHNHMIKHKLDNTHLAVTSLDFRVSVKNYSGVQMLHTCLFVCVCAFISLFPQQTSSGMLSGYRSFHLLVQQQGFYHFHSNSVSHWEVFCVHCVIEGYWQSQSISCSSTKNTSQRMSVRVYIYLQDRWEPHDMRRLQVVSMDLWGDFGP